MSRRVWTWVAHVVAWSLLVAGVTVLFLERRSDDPEPTAAGGDARYAAMPFPSTLSLEGPDRGRIGSVFRFAAEGFSDKGLTSVTLYDGARTLDVVRPAGTDAGGSSSLQLPALSVGRHTVHAELTDEDGKTSETAPVTVLVGQAPGDQDIPVPVPVLPDEDAGDVAERIGVPVANVLLGTGKARGTAVLQIAPDAGVALLNSPDLAIVNGPALDGLTISAVGKDCGVTLEAKGADELTFFRGGGSGSGWVQVGRPQKDGTTDVPDLSPGTHVFFARAGKGASGELESGKVEVKVPDRCRDAYGWTGTASIVDGELAVPQANAQVFLHLSVDSKPWIRVPASQDELIYVGTRTSIAHLLPALNGKRLQLEVWRVSGDTAVQMASGELRVPTDATLASVVGQPTAISLTVQTPDGPRGAITLKTKHQKLEFEWAAASPAATRVRWQVLTTNSDASNLALNPPGLLASGVSEASGGAGGTFTVDTASIPRGDAKPAPSKGSGQGPGKGSVAVALKPPMPSGTLTDKPSYGAIVPVTDLIEVAQPVELPVEGSTVFVRVVAETGPAAASPSVFVQLPTHQSEKTGVDFTVNTVKVDAGRAPNPKAVGCLIVKVPWDNGALPRYDEYDSGEALVTYVASQFYPQSGVVCPGAFPPPKGCDAWYCEVVDFIVDAAGAIVSVVVQVYELVAYAYNGVISGVTSIISKLNPVCLALGAGGAGEAAKSCETVTGYATKAAIGAVLASVGLPPSLPSAEQLEAIASGELDQLAVELMKQLGVPCDAVTPPEGFDSALATAGEELDAPVLKAAANPCLAVAHLLIGEVRAQATANAEQAMADASGLPAFPTVPGFSMTPDPRGQADPLTVEVSASVTDPTADPTGISCQVIVEDPHRSDVNFIGPYPWFTIKLQPSSSNGRTWKGVGARIPAIRATTVADLQGATYDVGVQSLHPSDCRIPLTIEPVTVRPFDP